MAAVQSSHQPVSKRKRTDCLTYGEVRRLRDYLQRCLSAYQDEVELDLSVEDRGLLVACCRRIVESLDTQLEGVGMIEPKERQFLVKKRQVICDWAVELAENPLIELPIPGLSQVHGEGYMALKSRLQAKLYKLGQQSIITPGQVDDVEGWSGSQAGPIESAPTVDLFERADLESQAHRAPLLLDPQGIDDPRLRSLITLDLRSLDLAMQSEDYRIASVMLAAVLEAALIDYAMSRRTALGLDGTPDTWRAEEVLLSALGQAATANDRSLAYSLFYTRNLLKPGHQLVSPTVVTVASVQRLFEFVESVLHKLGFRGAPNSSTQSPKT